MLELERGQTGELVDVCTSAGGEPFEGDSKWRDSGSSKSLFLRTELV